MPFKSSKWYPALEYKVMTHRRPEIQIAIDKTKSLSITDKRYRYDPQRRSKYINQVAFSSAEEFIQKYQGKSDQAIIGHFGLGSTLFMVAQKVEIDTFPIKKGQRLFIGLAMVPQSSA